MPECPKCGAAVPPNAGLGRPRRYCDDCRRPPEGTVVKAETCLRCGDPIEQPSRGRPRKFCSTECAYRHLTGHRPRGASPRPLKVAKPKGKEGAGLPVSPG